MFQPEGRLSVLVIHVDMDGVEQMYMIDRTFYDRKNFIRRTKNLAAIGVLENENTAAKRVLRLLAPQQRNFDFEVVRAGGLGIRTYAVTWFPPLDWTPDEHQPARRYILSATEVNAIRLEHRQTFLALCEKAKKVHQTRIDGLVKTKAA